MIGCTGDRYDHGVSDADAQPGTLTVLMPVHNERATLERIIDQVLGVDLPAGMGLELIGADDASTDGSGDLLDELARRDDRIRVVRLPSNTGKGAAVRAAIGAIRHSGPADIAVIQDADLEYDPRDFVRLIEPIIAAEADAVYGSRFITSGRRQVHRFWHAQANRFLTSVCNALSDLSLTDMETCYKAVRADVLTRLPLVSNRFEIEVELTMRLARSDARLYEVPISYRGRTREEGKKIGFADGLEALWSMVRFRFDRPAGR